MCSSQRPGTASICCVSKSMVPGGSPGWPALGFRSVDRELIVRGVGEASAMPDLASVRVGVDGEGPSRGGSRRCRPGTST